MKYPSGYGMVFKRVMCDPSIKVGVKALYALLASYTGSDEVCWPSMETLAKSLGCVEQSVRNWMRALETAGWVEIETSSGRYSNRYRMVLPPTGVVEPPTGIEGRPPTGVDPTINNETKNNDKKESAPPMPSVGATVPTKPVTDLFSALFSEKRGGGARFTFKQYYVFPTQTLIRRNGLEAVLSKVRAYFAGEWWFTRVKGETDRHTWSYSGFLAHYDEIDPGAPARENPNAEAASRLVRRTV